MTIVTARPGLLSHPFGERYAARIGALPGAPHAWVDGLRQSARAILGAQGLPGPKSEAWKFTSAVDLAKTPFIPANLADDIDVVDVPHNVPRIEGAVRIVTVNGIVRRDLSDAFDKIDGVSVLSLREALAAAHETLKAVIGGLASPGAYPMAAVNTAYMADGFVIQVAKNVQTTRLHLISIGAAGAEPVSFHPRSVIGVAAGGNVALVETHVGLPGHSYFSNPVTEAVVGQGGVLKRYVMVDEDADAFHGSVSAVSLAARATYEDFRLCLGGRKVRQDIVVNLEGEGGNAQIHGAYALARSDHADISTFIDHAVPCCTSAQEFKGVVAGKSHAVFQGRIRVAKDAQKTNATQSHKGLFLNPGPVIDCKPELEIFADDVQCAHGAATGEVDEGQLFYLMSRGIDPDTARGLLIAGFVEGATEKISDEPVRAAFVGAIETWLKRRLAEAVAL
ncbi:MAG: Fe-S cluster assembly protein SufD [Rhodobacteraceae bacterium]|nr:Fe-S cluster assembly protein SufD [Paracoccaceae bacterium]